MKIAMLAPSGSVHTLRWSRGLASRGHDIQLISNSASPVSPPGISARFLPGAGTVAYFRNIPALRRIVRELEPDIVHAHYATGYGLWGSCQRSAPLVVSVWGTDIADAFKKRWSVGLVVRRALRSAQYVTATSRFLMEQTIAFAPNVSGKIKVVPFGVPIRDNKGEHDYSSDKDTITIVFAKAYLRNYGPDLVLKAFAGAHQQMDRLRLIMIGGGEMHDELERLAQTLQIASVVIIKDRVEPDAAGRIIEQGDIFVMPSYAESFGVAAVEAASYGLPVIASNVGGIPEVVQDGVTGILIPPGDTARLAEAMVRLATDGGLRRSMGEAGRRLAAEQYDFERCLDAMEAIYQKIVAA